MPTAPSKKEPVPQIDQKKACFALEVRPSPIHRWGIYAQEPIPKGRKIIEYTGEKINRKETNRRADGPLNYLFTLTSYWTIDGSVGGSGAQYINHCCTPNCYAWIHKGHILYMSAREIQVGEELTIDYRFDHDVAAVPCACGAPGCRGTINLKKEPQPRKKAARKATKKTVKKTAKTVKTTAKKRSR